MRRTRYRQPLTVAHAADGLSVDGKLNTVAHFLHVEQQLFGGIKNARFRKQVTPGDVLTLHCELVEQRGPVGIGKASAYVDGKCAATAELTFVLT